MDNYPSTWGLNFRFTGLSTNVIGTNSMWNVCIRERRDKAQSVSISYYRVNWLLDLVQALLRYYSTIALSQRKTQFLSRPHATQCLGTCVFSIMIPNLRTRFKGCKKSLPTTLIFSTLLGVKKHHVIQWLLSMKKDQQSLEVIKAFLSIRLHINMKH